MSHYQKLKALKTGFSTDFRTAIYARSMSGSKEYERFISGTPPLILTDCVGKPLVSWSITGNTEQNGTPTPDNPVEVKCVGDKTENLLDESTMVSGYYGNSDFVISSGSTNAYRSFRMYLKPGTYTLSGENLRIPRNIVNGTYDSTAYFDSLTFTVNEYSEVGISFRNRYSDTKEWDNRPIMLNEGSEPLPYKPYGYEIPVVSGSLTIPIYLDTPLIADEQLKSDGTRDVKWKKVVFTGDENIEYSSDFNRFKITSNEINLTSDRVEVFCNKFDGTDVNRARNNQIYAYNNAVNIRYNALSGNITALKMWLQQEYANGTPLTIYYPLTEPTSETISVPQIPTAKGTNTISIDTEVQPANMEITYKSGGKA